ncbi:mechanosensitive ion channel family protein [Desulfobotulus sp. H1]|uniref:Mechanosensitive ion channel family protein n=1 Tax=Desulfobotulus pelophilus TaxID=2823377 RepID=A0ABT3NB18_9BACT|nr:mechanosensitive ion channel family protein [Desulfobotulus pelophilus]MCW7754655.1 mechanosensitive ion channel family protein [Desulfobotulus pelophilus]
MDETAENIIDTPYWLPVWLGGIWDFLASYPFVLGIVILAVGFFVAFLVRRFILFWGLKLTEKANADLMGQLVRMGAGVAAAIIVYLSLVTALHTLPLHEFAITLSIRILISLLILKLIRTGLRASHLFLEMLGRVKDRFAIVEERTLPLFDLIMTVIVIAIGSYALLQVWNIDATAWLASAGVIGIAVGFAARDTLANLFAGFFIIADAPYKLGDYVVLDGKERGEVTKVGIRSTRLLTRDDVEVIIPNSVMANTKIVNESGGRWLKYRIRIKVGVAYGSDVNHVVDVLEAVARKHPTVCRDPEARVRMRGFGDSSLDFELLCWIEKPEQRGLVSHELFMAVYKALGSNGIEIPFPQRDLWVRGMPEKPSCPTKEAE